MKSLYLSILLILCTSAYAITLNYPSNETIYYATYNGSISITDPKNVCYINDSKYEYMNQHNWYNSSYIVSNQSLSISCQEEQNYSSGRIVPDNYGDNNGVYINTTLLDGFLTNPFYVNDSGYFGNAINWSGTSQSLKIGVGQDHLNNTRNFCAMAWTKKNTVNGTNNRMVYSFEEIFYVRYDETNNWWRFSCYDGGSNNVFVSSKSTDWEHVASCSNTTHMIVYVNGTEMGDVACDADFDAFSRQYYIATNYDASSQYFNGTIDEFRLYDQFLNESQIKQEMNNAYPIHEDLLISYSFEPWGSNISHSFNTDQIVQRPGEGNTSMFEIDTPEYGAIIDATGAEYGKTICNNGCSMSAYIKPKQTGEDMHIVSRYDSTGNNRFFRFYVGSNMGAVFTLSKDGVQANSICKAETSAGTLNADTWYHLIGVYNTTDCDLYINGTVEAHYDVTPGETINATAWTDDEVVCLGGFGSNCVNGRYNGSIYEVGLWNQGLTQSHINAMEQGWYFTYLGLVSFYSLDFSALSGSWNQSTFWFYPTYYMELEDKLLLGGSSSFDCYANITLNNATSTNLNYHWTDENNNTFRSGSTTCQHNQLCTVDTLTNTQISAYDGFVCHINLTVDNKEVLSNTTRKYKSTISKCDALSTYPIINFTYKEEDTDVDINLNSRYDLLVYDGTDNTLIQFNSTNTGYDTICSNVDPSIQQVNYSLYGNITLEKVGYNTRVQYIPFEQSIAVSNDPYVNMSLYLLDTNVSNTMTYNWYKLSFEPINGNMLIHRCELDGSKTLVDAPLITDGVATSNLLQFTETYSYSVVIDGTTYTDDSYTACHVESVSERTFFVDTNVPALEPITDIYGAYCKLWQSGADTVKMSFNADQVLEACILGYRATATGKIPIYSSCVNSSSTTMTRTISNNTNTYHVQGTLSDGINTITCPNDIVITVQTESQQETGVFGAFAVGMMVLAFALLFSPNGQLQTIASSFAMIISFGLGIVAFGWEAIVMLIIFLLVALVIGRYWKKE